MEERLREELDALEESRAFADRSSFRKIEVRGDDGLLWLNDLVTNDVATLEQGEARRALLLTPTGRIMADFAVARTEDALLLYQDDAQPDPIDRLLSPYILTSDVRITDVTNNLSLFCVIGSAAERVGRPGTRPSVLGEGLDLTCPSDDGWRMGAMLMKKQLTEVADEALEFRRIRDGRPRFPVDLDTESLPSEANLRDAIDEDKGCYLGQESVARVRNLGHPPRVVLHMSAEAKVQVGETVFAGPSEVGVVTSSAAIGGITNVLVRVRWVAADAPLATSAGVRLERIEPAHSP
jgi:folate-binding protein YgfZ